MCPYTETHLGVNWAVQQLCWVWNDGTKECQGGQRTGCGSGLGQLCQYTFEAGETLTEMHLWAADEMGSTDGRLRRIDFKTIKLSGQQGTFECGPVGQHNTGWGWYGVNVQGMAISGFFGQASGDVDQLGVLVMPPKCPVVKYEIIKAECVNAAGSACASTWTDTGDLIGVDAKCDACGSSYGTTSCDFRFSWTSTSTISTTSKSIDVLGGSVTVTGNVGLTLVKDVFNVGGSISFGVNYAHTWANAKSQTATKSGTVLSICQTEVPAGHATIAKGFMRAGMMKADVKLTVRSTTSCGVTSSQEHPAEIIVHNVPSLQDITSCTFSDASCSSQNELEAPSAHIQ